MATRTDDPIPRILSRFQPWLAGGSALLWLLGLGIGALLVFQTLRDAPEVGQGLPGFGELVAMLDLVVLMLGVGFMALTLGRQGRATRAALDGEGSVGDVLRLGRQFWWGFAVTLVTVSLLGCAAVATGAAGTVWSVVGEELPEAPRRQARAIPERAPCEARAVPEATE